MLHLPTPQQLFTKTTAQPHPQLRHSNTSKGSTEQPLLTYNVDLKINQKRTFEAKEETTAQSHLNYAVDVTPNESTTVVLDQATTQLIFTKAKAQLTIGLCHRNVGPINTSPNSEFYHSLFTTQKSGGIQGARGRSSIKHTSPFQERIHPNNHKFIHSFDLY